MTVLLSVNRVLTASCRWTLGKENSLFNVDVGSHRLSRHNWESKQLMLVTGLLFILCGRTLKPRFSSPSSRSADVWGGLDCGWSCGKAEWSQIVEADTRRSGTWSPNILHHELCSWILNLEVLQPQNPRWHTVRFRIEVLQWFSYVILLSSTTWNSQQSQCLHSGSPPPPPFPPALHCQQSAGEQPVSLQALIVHRHSAILICLMALRSSSGNLLLSWMSVDRLLGQLGG